MAQTVNGYIATVSDETPWSDEEWNTYHSVVKRVGNIIIGRRTYEMMRKSDEFRQIGNPATVIVTSDPHLKSDNSQFYFAKSPREALKTLKVLGFKETLVGGGGQLNTSFMKEGLVDEIYLDVEPLMFGKGIPLFTSEDFDCNLELLGIKKLNANTVQLHYKVVR